jgi:hypothetical protein
MSAGAAFSQHSRPSIDSLRWLCGCWELNIEGRRISEHWMKPAGRIMLGMSRTVSGEKTAEFEFLRIVQDEKEEIYYIARPSGQQEASFRLAECGPGLAVFENMEHDFPQRIIYRTQFDDSLHARIEGTFKGKEKRIDFPMKKTGCE